MEKPKALLSDGMLDPKSAAMIIDSAKRALQFYSGAMLSGIVSVQYAQSIEDKLRAFRLPITNARFMLRGATLTPVLRTENRSYSECPMQLNGYPAELRGSPKEKVAQARKVMIDLLTHELDEWLFKAGLADDPHDCWNEQDNAELNIIYERGTAQL